MWKRRPAPDDDAASIRATALNLLARRDHSILELRHKLAQRGYSKAAVEPVLDELVEEDWLSESRYAEAYSSSRAARGFGPVRIRHELRERGLSAETIAVVLSELADDWQAHLERLYQQRFGPQLPADTKEYARQVRFFTQRGFSNEQIRQFYRTLKAGD